MAKKIGYSGFDGLNKKIDLLQKASSRIERNGVTVGIHEDEGAYKNGTTVAQVATIHEYGGTIKHPGGTKYTMVFGQMRFISNQSSLKNIGVTKAHDIVIPERSFFRTTMKEKAKDYKKAMIKILRNVVESVAKDKHDNAENLMGKLGQKVVNDIQAKIVAIKEPPNAPSTIRQKKGVNNPLVDTGQMLGSVRWKYSKKEPKDD